MPDDYDDRMPGLDEVRTVLSFYALDQRSVRKIEPLANAGGWSGSRLWRICDAAGRELCLRRWPAEHPTVERLRLIHAALGLVSFEMPMVAFPPSALMHSCSLVYLKSAG